MGIINHSDELIIVELPPEPDIRGQLDVLLQTPQATSNCDIIIDFANVDIMTSTALSGFLKVRELMAGTGRRIIFCNAKPITKDIFEVTCFDGIFEFMDDKQQAIETLTKPLRSTAGP